MAKRGRKSTATESAVTTSASTAGSEVKSDALAQKAFAAGAGPDPFVLANREIDELYQQVKESDESASKKLSMLNLTLRLKMTLVKFEQSEVFEK